MTRAINSSGIYISKVRISNFRSIKNISMKIGSFNVLIGENNAGKTSFLEALFAAIGVQKILVTTEDIFLKKGEKKVPNNRNTTIDILLQPVNEKNEVVDKFPVGSFWLKHFGNAISLDLDDNEFIALRTEFIFDVSRGEYIPQRKYLMEWKKDGEDWVNSKIKIGCDPITQEKLDPIALYYIDSKRDIEDEIKNLGSFWHRMVCDLGIGTDEIEQLEKDLDILNNKITQNSPMLNYIQENLNSLHKIITCEKESVCITPLIKNIRNIDKDVNINFSTVNSETFPIKKHGAGTRSLASLLIFNAYINWRMKRLENGNVHPMLALEEPEVNLHPQAQRALFDELYKLPGQIFVSTHSPYVSSQGNVEDFCHFYKENGETQVTKINTSSLEGEDIRKIKRMVLNTRGDILFARAVVFFEGETEEQSLPVFAEKYWDKHPNSLGVTFISVDGCGKYLPFLRLVDGFKIPWFIFSDAEEEAVKAIEKALEGINIVDYKQCNNVIMLPNGFDLEAYIVSERYEDAISKMLDEYNERENYIDYYISTMNGQKLKGGRVRDYTSAGGRERAVIDILRGEKTIYGSLIADYITNLDNPQRRFPPKIRDLLNKISSYLSI